MDRTKHKKKDPAKVNSDRVELIYFNNRVVKVPVISVELSDGKQNSNNAAQTKESSKIELQELGLELNVPSYSSQFQKKLGSSSECSPTELLVEQEAFERLKQNEINQIKVVHNPSLTARTSLSKTTTPVSKITSSRAATTRKNAPITSKGQTSSNQRRSKSAPPKNVKSSKPIQKSSMKTPSINHFLASSKGLPVPRLLVDVTSTSHQPTKKLSNSQKTSIQVPPSTLIMKNKLQSMPDAQNNRTLIFSLSSSSDESEYDYAIDSINHRINSQLRTSVSSSLYEEPNVPKTQERGRSAIRAVDMIQSKNTPSKSNSKAISVDTFIRDTKEVMHKEKLQRERIKEVLSVAPVLKKPEEESSEHLFRTPQAPASKQDIPASSRMQEIKQMFQNQQAVTSDSETDDELAQQRMQTFLQRIRKTTPVEELPFQVQPLPQTASKKKVEKEEEGLTDREERIKMKEKLVEEKASSLKKLKSELEFKELEIFKLQEETLGEIEKQKERLRKKELKLRKFQEKMKITNPLESDFEETSSASEWTSSRDNSKEPKTTNQHQSKTNAKEPPKHVTVQNEGELIKNELDNRILELRKLLESKRQQKEGQNTT